MKKYSLFLFLPLAALILWSCSRSTAHQEETVPEPPASTYEAGRGAYGGSADESNAASSAGEEGDHPESEGGEEHDAPLSSAKEHPGTASDNQVIGSFKSYKGVMKPISCYCYNCGTVTTESGEVINVCFEDDDVEVDCKRVSLTGEYRSFHNDGSEGACAAGDMDLYVVLAWECD